MGKLLMISVSAVTCVVDGESVVVVVVVVEAIKLNVEYIYPAINMHGEGNRLARSLTDHWQVEMSIYVLEMPLLNANRYSAIVSKITSPASR